LPGVTVRWCDSPFAALASAAAWRRMLGFAGLARFFMRLMKGRRSAALASVSGRPAGYVYVTRGFCRYYTVASRDAVIGPVFVRPSFRGRGIAGCLVANAVRRASDAGAATIWIDTSEDNAAMLRIIGKCGFEGPVDEYERNDDA